jgi:Holliday junction resolvase RusA-like endonuclease
MPRTAPFTPGDFRDRPFGLPEPINSLERLGKPAGPIVTVVDLPFPPSTNRIWGHGGANGVTLSKDYRAWKDAADKFVLYTGSWRRARKISGPFTFELVLDANERRRGGDLDNRIKATLDWCQSRELIRNDSDCDDVHAYWGEAPHGCRVTLTEIVSCETEAA